MADVGRLNILLTFLLYLGLFLITHYDFVFERTSGVSGGLFYAMNFCSMVFDASLATLFTRLCSISSFRVLHYFPFVVFWIFCMANVLYLRQFGVYVDITMIGEVRNIDILGPNLLSLVRVRDFFLSALFFLVVVRWAWKPLPARLQWIRWHNLLVVALFSFLGIYGLVAKGTRTWSLSVFSTMARGSFSDSHLQTFSFGFTQSIVHDAVLTKVRRSITEQDRAVMARHISIDIQPDTVLYSGHRPNLIFVLMEGILSETVTQVCGTDTVMPHLWRLAQESRYSFLNMRSEAKLGWSSDGQFIYMTGLVPHTRKVVVNNYADNLYHGLGTACKSLGMQTAMVIPTGSHIWHQDNMCKAYGIDSLYSAVTLGDVEDEELFDFAQAKLHNLMPPFFLTVLNMTTHTPFSTHFEYRRKDFCDKDIPENKLCYFERAHYFDYHLARFIRNLKESGLWNTSIVVLASDHHLAGEWIPENHRDPIPFIITGGAVPDLPDVNVSDTICQTDFYPTVLHMLGIRQSWCGVGRDLFDDVNPLSDEEKQVVSDIVLETDWFRNSNFKGAR